MSSTQAVPFATAPGLRVTPRLAALALPAILVFGFALRIGAGLTQTHVLFFDETLQYFEQGHRLAFGSGMVPWEFADGVRSWLLPGLIALAIQATSLFGDNPMFYVGFVRTLCAALSMVIVVVGYRAGEREGGRMGAIVTGGFCAIWFDLVYFAPAVMTEVLAAHCAIVALYLGQGGVGKRDVGQGEARQRGAAQGVRTTRRVYWIGALAGLAVCLRYQYAPPLLLALAWQFRRDLGCWQWLFLGFASVLLPFSGVLDAITWGAAFQSIWLNFARNSLDGIASVISRESPAYYTDYLIIGLLPLPLMLGLAGAGARRFPALAIAAAATLVMHSCVPHKEVRFIYLTLAAMPILIGLGAAEVLRVLAERHGPRVTTFGVPGFLAVTAALSWFIATGPLAPRWSFERGMVHAFLAAHREPELCGLQVRDIPAWKAGGYTYLNRDVPLTFDPPPGETVIPGVSKPLHGWVEREGGPIPQLRSPYSHVVAEASHRPAGFSTVICFPNDAQPGEPELCLFRRPTGCS